MKSILHFKKSNSFQDPIEENLHHFFISLISLNFTRKIFFHFLWDLLLDNEFTFSNDSLFFLCSIHKYLMYNSRNLNYPKMLYLNCHLFLYLLSIYFLKHFILNHILCLLLNEKYFFRQ